MPSQITIIGTGQIGASIGMALGSQPGVLARVGHDREMAAARAAQSKGAVDRISFNLPASVENANLVLLALPQDEIRPTMQIIGPDLRAGTIVLDTAPSKSHVQAVMAEFLPKTCHYVGLLPVIGPVYLHGLLAGVENAHADLFKRSLVGIIAPPGTQVVAIEAAAGLVERLGADKMFMDLAEADSLMAGLHILPDMVAAALLETTIGRGGWYEGKKLAERPFALATTHLGSEGSSALAQAAMSSQEHTLRHLRSLITALESYAALVQAKDQDALLQKLETVHAGYLQWRNERDLGGWTAEELAPPAQLPSSGEWFRRFIGLRSRPQKRK